jgi:hypothetical protein
MAQEKNVDDLTQELHEIYSLHEEYLPFSEDTVKKHFIESSNKARRLAYYTNSISNYKDKKEKPKDGKVRQIEKDEKFWTISSLLTLYYDKTPNFTESLLLLLKETYGTNPPLPKYEKWEKYLEGELELFFEPKLPSSKSYLDWLNINIKEVQFIPFILEKAKKADRSIRADLEGETSVDAIIINPSNGFSIIIEAKVLSDISSHTTYNETRNQLIRNIDIMLEKNRGLKYPLNERDPDNSLFLLLTPEIFKNNSKTRFYGYKFLDYKMNPCSIGEELKHRNYNGTDLINISKRLGWTTWEDLNKINNNCCKWLDTIQK